MRDRIRVIRGDITRQAVDAVVNAANTTLLGGGGVDGAIHAAAGPALLEECRKLGGCPTGEAKITRGFHLPARWVIHTVGPVWYGGTHREDDALARCYRSTLRLAQENGVQTIAFPSISTGAYRFPVERAASIALHEIIAFLRTNLIPSEVRIVCFDPRTFEVYDSALRSSTGVAGQGA